MTMLIGGVGLLAIAAVMFFSALPHGTEVRSFLRKEWQQAGFAVLITGAFFAGLTLTIEAAASL